MEVPPGLPGSDDGASDLTLPDRMASMVALAVAKIEVSPAACKTKVEASELTWERTSLRTITPPAATAPPPLETLADIAASAVMPESSVADTVMPPAEVKVDGAAETRRFLPSI